MKKNKRKYLELTKDVRKIFIEQERENDKHLTREEFLEFKRETENTIEELWRVIDELWDIAYPLEDFPHSFKLLNGGHEK